MGQIIVRMGADARPLLGGLAQGESAISRFSSRAASRGGMANLMGGGAGAIGASMALASTGIGAAIGLATRAGSAITGAIGKASDLNETLSKTDRIFGPAADAIIGKAGEMNARFGTSKEEYINAATSFGAVFKGIGRSQQDAAGLGNQLALLGLDMASFDNSSNSEVFTALQAALRGEFDPLERFRVFLSAAKVEEEALTSGLARNKKEIDDNAKKQATLNLILAQTKDAQNDLAITSGGAANQFRQIGGQVENLSLALGAALLPAVQRGTVLISGFLAKATATFDSVAASVSGFAGGFMTAVESTVIPGFMAIGGRLAEMPGAIAAALGPGATGMISGFASSIKTFVLDTIDMVGFAWRNLPDLVDVAVLMMTQKVLDLGAVFEAWGTNVGRIGEWFATNWVQIITDGVNRVGTVFQNLGTNISSLWAGIQSLLAGNGFQFEWTPLLQGFEATVGALPEMVDPVYTSLQGQIDDKMGVIADNEAKRARAMELAARGPDGAAPPPPGKVEEELKKAEKGDKYHATAAVELGSKEFSSAIARHANQASGSDDKPIKTVAANSRDQLNEARAQTPILKSIADKLGTPVAAAAL